jgi:flagellar basal body-associated protein FliL
VPGKVSAYDKARSKTMMLILLLSIVLVPLALAVIFVPLVMGVRANRAAHHEHALRHADGSPVEVDKVHDPAIVRAA